MIKKQLVSTGIILSLIGSNIITGKQYIDDSKKYEQKLSFKTKIIEQNKQKLSEMVKKTAKNEQKMTDLTNKINLLTQDKNNLIIENEKLKKEKENLKKQIPSRGEVMNYRKLNMVLTFYGADCHGCSGKTAVGLNVRNTIYYNGMRVIAVDPRVIKLHSIVKIESEKETFYAYAGDTGGAIKGNIIDVLVSSERESIKHGRQNAVITILREGQ